MMTMKMTLLTLVVLLAAPTLGLGNSPVTHRVRKTATVFTPTPLAARAHQWRAGSAVPISGGTLTLGSFLIDVTVGTGAGKKTLPLIVDTGSANLAVPSDYCPNCGAGKAPFFNHTASPSYTPLGCGAPACGVCVVGGERGEGCIGLEDVCDANNAANCGFGISYGGSSSGLEGTLGTDVACLGGDDSLCAKTNVGLISNSVVFAQDGPDFTGILGLSWETNACNPTCIPTAWGDVAKANGLPDLFGMCLTQTAGGAIDFGGINASRFSGDLAWAPVTTQRWYNLHVQGIAVGGNKVDVPSWFFSTRNDAIGSFVDSGTTVVLMGPVIFDQFASTFTAAYPSLPGLKSILGGQCVSKDSINVASYPNVVVSLAGEDGASVDISIPPSSYLMDAGSVYCPGIAGGVPSLGVILGDVALENYYVVYDRANTRVGFAPLVKDGC